MSCQPTSWSLATLLGFLGASASCMESVCLSNDQPTCQIAAVTPGNLQTSHDHALTVTIDGTVFNAALQAGEDINVSLLQSNRQKLVLSIDLQPPLLAFVPAKGQPYKLKVSGLQLAMLAPGQATLQVTAGARAVEAIPQLQIHPFFPSPPQRGSLAAVALGFVKATPHLFASRPVNLGNDVFGYKLSLSAQPGTLNLNPATPTHLNFQTCSASTSNTSFFNYCNNPIMTNSEFYLNINQFNNNEVVSTSIWSTAGMSEDFKITNPLLIVDPNEHFVLISHSGGLSLLNLNPDQPTQPVTAPARSVGSLSFKSPADIAAQAAGDLIGDPQSEVVLARKGGGFDVLVDLSAAPVRDTLFSESLLEFWTANRLGVPRALAIASVDGGTQKQLLALTSGGRQLLVLWPPKLAQGWQLDRIDLPAMMLDQGDDVVSLTVGDVYDDGQLELLVATGPAASSPPAITNLYVYRNQPE